MFVSTEDDLIAEDDEEEVDSCSDDASGEVSLGSSAEDHHLVGTTVSQRHLVTQPTKETWQQIWTMIYSDDIQHWLTFLRVHQLLPPGSAVPADLTEASVDTQTNGDGEDPDGIEEEDTGGHEDLEIKDDEVRQIFYYNVTVWQHDLCSL